MIAVMSQATQNVEHFVCRLCTSTESGQLQIFSKEGEGRQLSQKIKECLPIELQEDDTITKSICGTCARKVEEFHKFRQSCLHAQSALKGSLKSEVKIEVNSDVTDEPVTEVDELVERLQAGGNTSALSITPVAITGNNNKRDMQHLFNSSGALSITPVMRNSESSGDDDSQWGNSSTSPSLPRLKDPRPEDYVLMQEETLKLDSIRSHKQESVEFSKRVDDKSVVKDRDVMETQYARRVVLPPMWDVYEKTADKENVVHRRYVVSKSSFPCSLCGSCVAFHRQQALQQKNQDHSKQDLHQAQHLQLQHLVDFPHTRSEIQNDTGMSLQEQQHDLEQQIMKDLRVPHFPPQEVGMLDCPECGKLFPRRSSWKRHLRTHYEGRAFICYLCGKGFNRKEHLSRHMMSHTGGRPFRCETCFKPFTRKEHLARHLACNTGCGNNGGDGDGHVGVSVPRPYTCDICYQGFVRKEHMLRHRKRAHLLMEAYVAPPLPMEEEDVRPYSCNRCFKSFGRKEHLIRHSQIHARELSLSNTTTAGQFTDVNPNSNFEDKDQMNEKPEQIEVEVNLNLLGGSDQDSEFDEDEEEKSGNGTLNGEQLGCGASAASVGSVPPEVEGEPEEVEMDQEDLLKMQMNEAMRQAREGGPTLGNQAPRCEVCQKSFTRRSHLVRHLRKFHPHVELAYAAAYSLGNVVESGGTVDPSQPLLPSSPLSTQTRDEASTTGGEDEAEDENGNNSVHQSPFPSRKGAQHHCSICGKMFGRRYHLVRHRRTQHGVESVKSGRVGRPPKRVQQSTTATPFRCSACGGQFASHSDFQAHGCNSNNNVINNKRGSGTVAEMAAKVSDKLLKGKVLFNCETCGRNFSNQIDLDQHVETHVSDLMEGMLWT